ncbi:MAG: c-type cytochrome [Rhodospirillales bacterium]|nr:c-type cytochrome [Rhodospirillales bacterium]
MPGPNPGADANNADQVALGKKVYADQCASCHGARLEGEKNWKLRRPEGHFGAPPHDETGHTWHRFRHRRHPIPQSRYPWPKAPPRAELCRSIGYCRRLR